MTIASEMTSPLPQLDAVQAAIAKLADQLTAVPSESIASAQASGRILAEDLLADRDSPALDVSAMDGYALRIADIQAANEQTDSQIPICGTAAAGAPPQSLAPGSAVRIFTGAPVPAEADCVVQREKTTELPDIVTINELPKPGLNIRRVGENIHSGTIVIESGIHLSPQRVGSLATFAGPNVQVRKRVRIAILNTGDELVDIGQPVDDWQIRDSNGPLLESWLQQRDWLEIVHRQRVEDNFVAVKQAVQSAAEQADAVILTGGVSMGDTDYVPDAITELGGVTAFHRLPIRPGKPVLGATLNGKLVLGLPGNPVSVAVTARVFGLPLLEQLAGALPCPPMLTRLANPDEKTLPLVWHRLIRVTSAGQVELVSGRGSGDVVALSQSDGIVVIPPGQSGPGPWPMLLW